MELYNSMRKAGYVSVQAYSAHRLAKLYQRGKIGWCEHILDEHKIDSISFPMNPEYDLLLEKIGGPVIFIGDRFDKERICVMQGNHRTAAVLFRGQDTNESLYAIRFMSSSHCQKLIHTTPQHRLPQPSHSGEIQGPIFKRRSSWRILATARSIVHPTIYRRKSYKVSRELYARGEKESDRQAAAIFLRAFEEIKKSPGGVSLEKVDYLPQLVQLLVDQGLREKAGEWAATLFFDSPGERTMAQTWNAPRLLRLGIQRTRYRQTL